MKSDEFTPSARAIRWMVAFFFATVLLPFALDLLVLPPRDFVGAHAGYSSSQFRLLEGASRELAKAEAEGLDFLFIGTSVFNATVDMGMIKHYLQGQGAEEPRILMMRLWAADMFAPLIVLKGLPEGMKIRHVFLEMGAMLNNRQPYSAFSLRVQDAWPYLRHATVGAVLSFFVYKVFFGPVKLKELLLPTRWRPSSPEPLDPWITGDGNSEEAVHAMKLLDETRGARRPRAFSYRPGDPLSPLQSLVEPKEFQAYLLGEVARICRERGIALHFLNIPMLLDGKIATVIPRLPGDFPIEGHGSDIFSAPEEFGRYREYFLDNRHIIPRGKAEFTWAMLPEFGRIYGENP